MSSQLVEIIKEMSRGDSHRYYIVFEDDGNETYIIARKYKMAKAFAKRVESDCIIFNGRLLPEEHLIYA